MVRKVELDLAVFPALQACIEAGDSAALATVIATEGSVPGRIGARLLLLDDGRLVGTIGGGRIEELVLERLRAVRKQEKPERLKQHLTRDLGMCCGGTMELLLEPIVAAPRLVLFGAGHVGKPTAQAALQAGFRVTVIDDREKWNSEARFSGCARVDVDAETWLRDEASLSPDDYVVIATHDHALDERIAQRVLATPPHYVGMIGSKRKAKRIRDRLTQKDAQLEVQRLHSPVGLDIGAETPQEIAVSIVAELIRARRQPTDAPASR